MACFHGLHYHRGFIAFAVFSAFAEIKAFAELAHFGLQDNSLFLSEFALGAALSLHLLLFFARHFFPALFK